MRCNSDETKRIGVQMIESQCTIECLFRSLFNFWCQVKGLASPVLAQTGPAAIEPTQAQSLEGITDPIVPTSQHAGEIKDTS